MATMLTVQQPSTHPLVRVCPSVRPPVRPSVCGLCSAAWQPCSAAHDNELECSEPPRPRSSGRLLPAQLKPPSQLELELAACSDEDKAAIRATHMPWLTGVAEKVRAEKAAEAQRQRLRQGNLNRKLRGVALSGGVLCGAFSTAREAKEEAEREKARQERELAKLRKRRENKRVCS